METIKVLFGGKSFGRIYLASIWSFFAMWFIGYIITHPIQPDALRFVDTILGFLIGTIVAGILGYYFGASQTTDENQKGQQPDASKSVTVTESVTNKDKP